EIAELRHRDAAKRQRGRIVAQGDVVQRGERIARCERTRRRRDQRVHSNPDTLVTPGRPVASSKSISRSTPCKPPLTRCASGSERRERGGQIRREEVKRGWKRGSICSAPRRI